jgi:hypothetical protein
VSDSEFVIIEKRDACPNCGYCKHCGRSNEPFRFVPYYPVYPAYPTYPTWPPYTITWGQNSNDPVRFTYRVIGDTTSGM